MRNYFELGPTPIEEDCLQMGVASNEECKAECERYKALLERLLPIPDPLSELMSYRVKFFAYDSPAGGYYEVVIIADDAIQECVDFVFNVVEANIPLTWDQQ